MSSISKNKENSVHFLFTLLLTYIATNGYVYSLLLYLKGNYYNSYQLEEGLFIGALYLIIYLLLTTLFFSKIMKSNWLKIGVTLLYAWVLFSMFSSIAFSMLADLSGGGTFTSSEVISTFVIGYKNSAALIITTIIVYSLFLRLLPLKTIKFLKN